MRKEGKTTLEVLDYLIDQEKHSKDASSQETRMKLAGFPVKKRLEDFDFDFQPSIDRAVISDITSLRFVHNAENVVFLGPPGVGKSHLAIALGIEAVKAGLSVYFTNAGSLIERLKKANSDGLLDENEKTSTIFTSNKSYGEWGEIFHDHVIAAAVLDRILHHCITVNIKGESYRLKERKKQGLTIQRK